MGSDRTRREFIIRLEGLPPGASEPFWKFSEPASWVIGGEALLSGRPAKDLRGVAASLPKSARTVSVSIGIGVSPWDTVARQTAGGSGMSSMGRFGKSWTVSFARATEVDGRTTLSVTHTGKDAEVRVVAVDNEGAQHTGQCRESSSTGAFSQMTVVFSGLPLAQAKEFQFQARPYQWVSFRQVSLEPGQRTAVAISAPPPVALTPER